MTVRTKLINRRYRVERRISLTGTTETWLGFDNVLHRAVAVSMPRQEHLRDGPFLEGFLQRSRIATALHHRGIVAAFDSGEDGETPYLITEYVGGESLTDIIRTESPFDVDDVAILVEQVASALDYAHQRGFVHGRLHSEEIVVDGQGAAKLLGLGVPLGTAAANGDGRTQHTLTVDDDIAALGAIAFEMLTGEERDAVELDSAGEAYLIAPDVPRNASDVVTISLGAGSAQFTSAEAFARALSDWRSFDPAEFFSAPEPEIEWSTVEPAPEYAGPPHFDDTLEPLPYSDETAESSPETSRGFAQRRELWLFAALLILMIAAGLLVWNSSEPEVGAPGALPSQLEALAQLTGF